MSLLYHVFPNGDSVEEVEPAPSEPAHIFVL